MSHLTVFLFIVFSLVVGVTMAIAVISFLFRFSGPKNERTENNELESLGYLLSETPRGAIVEIEGRSFKTENPEVIKTHDILVGQQVVVSFDTEESVRILRPAPIGKPGVSRALAFIKHPLG